MSNQEPTLVTPIEFFGGAYVKYDLYLAQESEIARLKKLQDAWESVNLPDQVPVSYSDLLLRLANLKAKHDKEKAEAMLQLGKMDKVWGARDAAMKEVGRLQAALRTIAGHAFDALGMMKNQHTKISNDPETLHYCGNCKAELPKDATSCPEYQFVFTANDKPINTMVLDPATHPPTSREQDIARAFEAGVLSANQRVLKAETYTRHWREETGKFHGKVRVLRDALQVCKKSFEEYAAIHTRKMTPEGDQKANQNIALANMCRNVLSDEITPPFQPPKWPLLVCQTCGHGQTFGGKEFPADMKMEGYCDVCHKSRTFGTEKPKS